MSTQLVENMLAAWDHRRREAYATARAALTAPGLVKPATAIAASEDFDRANVMCRYWSTIGATS